jgi:ubiquinone biosynthesis monooxygenase Coq7
MRNLSVTDTFLIKADFILKIICGGHHGARSYPASAEDNLTAEQKQHSIGLMRVNNVGEVCAQALYQAQALSTNNEDLVSDLEHAAEEEIDHLFWTETRLRELGGNLSLFNGVWYLGAFSMGYVAGICGDKWNLGFLAETEYQVTYHLEDYMTRLPSEDKRSYEIMKQMRDDELAHANMALERGGVELPLLVKNLMHSSASIMKYISYYI